MGSYQYRAKQPDGSVVTADLSAESEAQAFDMLDRMGLFPLEIKERRSGGGLLAGLSRLSFSRVSRDDVATFSRQLADLLRVGVTINKALSTLATETPNKELAGVVAEIKSDVSSGTRVSEAFAKFPRVFPPLTVNMVKAGETGGFLEDVLERIAKFTEQEQEIKSRIRAAMAYPTLLSFLAVGTVVFLMVYFIPQFSKMFGDLGGALPLPTRIVMGTSSFIRDWGLYVLAAMIAGGIGLWRALGTEAGRHTFDRLRLRVPVLGTLFTRTAVSRFARVLGTLLKSWVPILQALDITRDAVGNTVYARQVDEATVAVKEGKQLAEPLKQGKVFPDLVVGMIAVGEESGNLEDVLIAVSDSYDKQVDRSVRTLVSLLEPLMLVAMGVLVGFIVVSMILPIFEIQGMMK